MTLTSIYKENDIYEGENNYLLHTYMDTFDR